MKYHTVSYFAIASLISACSTPGDVRSTTPTLEADSSKPSKAVAGCIADKFELAYRTGVNSRPTSNGYSVWKEDDAGILGKITGIVIDVNDTAVGSKIKLFMKGALSSAADTAVRIVKECIA